MMPGMKLTNTSVLIPLLEKHGIQLKHSLGQNFLVNEAIIEKIVKLAEVSESDDILEVGPGAGVLTCAMLETGAKVTSIEMDERLYPVLEETTEFAKENFSLVEGDALEKISNFSMMPGMMGGCNKLVANLPYNVAATIILDAFSMMPGIVSETVMVQKEVADRIQATPGNKNYGAYTVKLRIYAEPVGSFFVGRNNFFPAPRVDSAVVRLNRRDIFDDARHDCKNKQVVLKNACLAADAAFFNRRKTIFNSMSGMMGKGKQEQIAAWLADAGIDQKIRGEKLEVEAYVKLGLTFDKFLGTCNN